MTHGYADDKPALARRLSRVEGQVRGIASMVADDRYCIDIITQVQAARAALGRVEADLLKAHVRHCVAGAVNSADADDQKEKLKELIKMIPRLTRD